MKGSPNNKTATIHGHGVVLTTEWELAGDECIQVGATIDFDFTKYDTYSINECFLNCSDIITDFWDKQLAYKNKLKVVPNSEQEAQECDTRNGEG